MSRSAASLFCVVLCACTSPVADDAGTMGSTGDAGPVEYIDGGLVSVGGCTSLDGSKFIARFQTIAPEPPYICILASFRRFDGGFSPIMENSFVPPAGYAMDDARYSNGCNFELPSGQLSTANTAVVTELWGSAEFVFVHQGRPQSFAIDGGIRLGERLFSLTTGFAGCNETCAGP